MQDTAEPQRGQPSDGMTSAPPESAASKDEPGRFAGLAGAGLSGSGLPVKLLLITILFVMLAEVLVFVPSIASFRINWLHERLTSARLAALATEDGKRGVVPPEIRRELLSTAKVRAVAIKKDEMRQLVLPSDEPLTIDATFDLRGMPADGFWSSLSNRVGLIGDALYVFIAPANRTILIYGRARAGLDPSVDRTDFVEIAMPEAPLRAAMIRHGLNVLGLSIIISIIAAAAVYLTLIQVLVRPMLRLTQSMLHFSENPEDTARIIEPSSRSDEIGVAERELAHMQSQLGQLLQQRRRLAELGLAVSKINHDLRNMLASAQLISDRLGELPDPTVQRFAPKLIASLDRAINFCNDTLRFGRAEEASPRRELFNLIGLVREVGDSLDLPQEAIDWHMEIPPTLQIDADRDQLYRVLNNLVRNALQAIESQGKPVIGEITVSARRDASHTIIDVVDDGPGVPARARENMFKAFQGGTRKGGSGLGLAIADELVRAHGGRIELVDSPRGAHFRIDIPDRPLGSVG